MVTTYMNIFLQCVQEPQIKVFCNSVYLSKATSRWAMCTHQELRLITKFAIGFLMSSTQTGDLLTLIFDEADALTVANLLHEAIGSRQTEKPFYFNISTGTLLNSLNHLLLLTFNHSDLSKLVKELIAIFKDESIVDVLFKLLSSGSKDEQLRHQNSYGLYHV